MAAAIQFERHDCTRCSGTGLYGGTVNGKPVGECFKCGGRKGPLTAAGRQAKAACEAWINTNMTRPAETVTAGTAVRHRGRWVLVAEVRRDGGTVTLMSGGRALDMADAYVVKPVDGDFAALADYARQLKGCEVVAEHRPWLTES